MSYHSHECENCKTQWAHADACGGLPYAEFEKAHSCPSCGQRQCVRLKSWLSEAGAALINETAASNQEAKCPI